MFWAEMQTTICGHISRLHRTEAIVFVLEFMAYMPKKLKRKEKKRTKYLRAMG
jgi:hypothetical protein